LQTLLGRALSDVVYSGQSRCARCGEDGKAHDASRFLTTIDITISRMSCEIRSVAATAQSTNAQMGT